MDVEAEFTLNQVKRGGETMIEFLKKTGSIIPDDQLDNYHQAFYAGLGEALTEPPSFSAHPKLI